MSNHDQAAAAILAQVALVADGAVLGLALAYVAVRNFIKFASSTTALQKIQNAPSLRVSDIRSVVSSDDSEPSDNEKLVIVCGAVEAKSAVDGNWRRHDVLVSHESREKAVVLLRTQTELGSNTPDSIIEILSSLRCKLFSRHWNRWKEWKEQRRIQRSSPTASEDVNTVIVADDEAGDVPDVELCVICLLRRRRSVFVLCGHLVCCQHCALSVERELTPKCPVCRQAIGNSVRIYAC